MSKIEELYLNSITDPNFNRTKIISLLEELHRKAVQYRSDPSDITADISSLRTLIHIQNATAQARIQRSLSGPRTAAQRYPMREDTQRFATVSSTDSIEPSAPYSVY